MARSDHLEKVIIELGLEDGKAGRGKCQYKIPVKRTCLAYSKKNKDWLKENEGRRGSRERRERMEYQILQNL